MAQSIPKGNYIISVRVRFSEKEITPLDFEDQVESDSIIDFIGDMLEVYREELNCFANERGGQTYSQQLVVTETLSDGTKATIDLSTLGTAPFQPKIGTGLATGCATADALSGLFGLVP